jgi:hypothetical protein
MGGTELMLGSSPWEGEAPAEPRDSILGGRGSCRAGFSSLTNYSAQQQLRPPEGRNPEAGIPVFGVVPVLRGLLFVNICGDAICSRAQDFALIFFFGFWL